MFIVLHRQSSKLPERFQVARMDRYRDEGDGSVVFQGSDFTEVLESPDEIDALIAQARRERDRVMIAGQVMAATMCLRNKQGDGGFGYTPVDKIAAYSVEATEALLAALNAGKGQ